MAERVTRGAAGKPQLRKTKSWSAAKRDKFLEHLAVSCNVAASCRKAGMHDSLVYRHRRTDAAFRAAWARAVAEAVERLEMMILERAMNGKVVEKTRSGQTIKTVEYPDHIAIALIRAHKDTVAPDETDDEETLAALREKISRKLDIVARREAAKAGVARDAECTDKSETATGAETGAETGAAADTAPQADTAARPAAAKPALGRDAAGRFVRRSLEGGSRREAVS